MTNLFERVLCAIALSPSSDRLLGCLEDMPGLGLKEARLIYALDRADVTEGAADMAATAGRELADMAVRLARLGAGADHVVMEGLPAAVIAGEALRWGATLILLGASEHGRLARLLVGDTAADVLHSAKTPVLVERRLNIVKGRSPLERALVPVDFSESSAEVLEMVRGLAGWAVKEVVLAHVVEGNLTKEDRLAEVESAESCLSDVALGIRGAGAEATVHVHSGRVAEELAGIAAEEKADVIVVGPHVGHGIREALSTGTAGRVLHASGVSVLYFPQ